MEEEIRMLKYLELLHGFYKRHLATIAPHKVSCTSATVDMIHSIWPFDDVTHTYLDIDRRGHVGRFFAAIGELFSNRRAGDISYI
jgi:hypothetical protein